MCSSHSINMSLFEEIFKQSKTIKENLDSFIGYNHAPESISNNSMFMAPPPLLPPSLNATTNLNKNGTMSLTRLAANAVEMRKTALARISESSSTQDISQYHLSPTHSKSKNGGISPPSVKKAATLLRAASFESHTSNEEDTVVTPVIGNVNNNSSPRKTRNVLSQHSTSSSSSQMLQQQQQQLDPSQVFLQLFQSQHFYNDDPTTTKEPTQPLLIPDTEAVNRSMNILDYIPCYMIHKIGVVYVGPNQANDEKLILSNANGSLRYRNFISGLGNLIHLKDMDTNRFYPGGLETDGTLGDFTLLWFDGITQVLFHVATMMLNKDENCNSKKRHIGNDSTIIVYNESGEEYQFGAIKGEVNCVCIEIIPLKSNTNIVKFKTTNEMQGANQQQLNSSQATVSSSSATSNAASVGGATSPSVSIVHTDPKFVSDLNLSIIIRKMALHADIASKVYRAQKEGNIYGGKWYERLRQLNRIKKHSKEYYAKQQPRLASTTPATSASTANLSTYDKTSFANASSGNIKGNESNQQQQQQQQQRVVNNNNSLSHSLHSQSDFTNYI